MSNFIPMVSSSPPPIDDSGGFDDWGDDDDFGTFTGADDSNLSSPGKTTEWNTSEVGIETGGGGSPSVDVSQSEAADVLDTVKTTTDSGIDDFANFATFNGEAVSGTVGESQCDDSERPASFGISVDQDIDDETATEQSETIKQSLTDSGTVGESQCDDSERPTSFGISVDQDIDDETAKVQSETIKQSLTDSGTVRESHCDDSERPTSFGISVDQDIDDETVTEQGETIETIKESLTDSGLYSTEISPVQHSDVLDSGNKSHSDSDSIGELHLDSALTKNISEDNCRSNSEDLTKDDGSYESEFVQINHSNDNSVNKESDSDSLGKSDYVPDVTASSEDVDRYENAPDSMKQNSEPDDVRISENIPQFSSHSFEDSEQAQENPPNKTDPEMDRELPESDKSKLERSEKNVNSTVEASDCYQLESLHSENDKRNVETDLENDAANGTSDSWHDSSQLNRSTNSVDADEDENYSDLRLRDKSETLNSGINAGIPEQMGSCNIEQEKTSEQNEENYQEGSQDIDIKSEGDTGSSSGDFDLNDKVTEPDSELQILSSTGDSNSVDVEKTNLDSHGSEHTMTEANVNLNNDEADINSGDHDDGDTETGKSADDFDDFSGFKSGDMDEIDSTEFSGFTDGDADFTKDSQTDDFGAFGETSDGFADFSATSVVKEADTSEQSGNWASFSEPQISESVTVSEVNEDDDDDDWESFGGDESHSSSQEKSSLSSTTAALQTTQPTIQNMSKQEKVLLAVTGCFSSTLSITDTDVKEDDESVLKVYTDHSEPNIWCNMRGLKTTNALTYHWSQSQWNSHLYHTLKVDTRNILFGHKKSSSMPIFASGLTMLEPTKGPVSASTRSHDTLIDTSKTEEAQVYTQVNTQETIPPAQFDWSSSGLTNPLEAANKTLNLDFLIQESEQTYGKSHALESEFLGPDHGPSQKPAPIQPLENILANLKSSSTFKPTNQNEDLSREASKIIQSLPNLTFMKTKVLMFPLKMNE